jgi:hypothetical protein
MTNKKPYILWIYFHNRHPLRWHTTNILSSYISARKYGEIKNINVHYYHKQYQDSKQFFILQFLPTQQIPKTL